MTILKVTCAAALDALLPERSCSCESAAANSGSSTAAQLASEARARKQNRIEYVPSCPLAKKSYDSPNNGREAADLSAREAPARRALAPAMT